MKIELENGICLIPLNLPHSSSLFNILTLHRSHFSPWLPFVNELHCIKQTENFIRESHDLWESKKDFSFAIHINDQVIGVISAKDLNWTEKSTELGYWIDPAFQNQGIVTKALIRLTEFLTWEFEFQTFWIKCAHSNLPSQRVAIKAGFEPVGMESRGDGKTGKVLLIYRRKV